MFWLSWFPFRFCLNFVCWSNCNNFWIFRVVSSRASSPEANFARFWSMSPEAKLQGCVLATMITKWDRDCDRQPHRLVCYIQTTLHYRLFAWIGDSRSDVTANVFVDADFAGDQLSMKSTLGVYLALCGDHTKFPLGCVSQKQTAVSFSIPKAEIIKYNVSYYLLLYYITCEFLHSFMWFLTQFYCYKIIQ